MPTTTEDRESPVAEIMEDAPFSDLEDTPTNLAPETPLTREAVIHLRAAGGELDNAYAVAMALLETVRRELNNPVVGADLTIDEDRAYDLWLLMGELADIIDKKMVREVFQRGRGERPHGDGLHLSLDEEGVRDLALTINTIAHIAASAVDPDDSRDLVVKLANEVSIWSDDLLKEIEEKVGADLYESTADTASERAETTKREAREEVES